MDTPIRQANKTAQKDGLKRIAVMAMPKKKNPRSRRVKFLIFNNHPPLAVNHLCWKEVWLQKLELLQK